MELTLIRDDCDDNRTKGDLLVNGTKVCFTLEPPMRNKKVFGNTAIPVGKYPVLLTHSPRFSDRIPYVTLGGLVPLLDNVPGFDGVRIHCGNTDADTEACILVGLTSPDDISIGDSQAAYKKLFPMLLATKKGGEAITLTIQMK